MVSILDSPDVQIKSLDELDDFLLAIDNAVMDGTLTPVEPTGEAEERVEEFDFWDQSGNLWGLRDPDFPLRGRFWKIESRTVGSRIGKWWNSSEVPIHFLREARRPDLFNVWLHGRMIRSGALRRIHGGVSMWELESVHWLEDQFGNVWRFKVGRDFQRVSRSEHEADNDQAWGLLVSRPKIIGKRYYLDVVREIRRAVRDGVLTPVPARPMNREDSRQFIFSDRDGKFWSLRDRISKSSGPCFVEIREDEIEIGDSVWNSEIDLSKNVDTFELFEDYIRFVARLQEAIEAHEFSATSPGISLWREGSRHIFRDAGGVSWELVVGEAWRPAHLGHTA